MQGRRKGEGVGAREGHRREGRGVREGRDGVREGKDGRKRGQGWRKSPRSATAEIIELQKLMFYV